MKHRPAVIAQAFLAASRKGKQEALVKNFAEWLRRRRLLKESPKIVDAIENALVKERGGRRITLETARPLPHDLRREIKKHFNALDLIREKTAPQHIAGLKIIIDNEMVIDGTLERKLKKLFNR